MGIRRAIIFLILIVSATSSSADSINGCGGFVEASAALLKSRKQSQSKLDYSHITVELRTVDGLVKESTQCAPNGYYFIPVYDKGSFVVQIKGPHGWSWEPDHVPVVIDHNGCNANADINFQFTGFTLSGRVHGAVGGESCHVRNGGPSNVKVELLSVADDIVSSALTSSTGAYDFKNIVPGKYKLRASHPDLNIEVRGSSQVELGFGNGVIDDIFFVRGYDINGFVVSQGNPILGVHLYLYSNDVLELNCPQGSGDAPWQKKALCHAVSDSDGRFSFSSVPCGTYELLPFYKGENTVFDVSPPSMMVSVEHSHLTILQKFQVTGFSVGGRVLDGNGVGVEDVKISLDGQERSLTDNLGRYKLDQVTSRHYTISAEKEHYKFKSLDNLLVLPNMASVPDVEATHFDVCGTIKLINNNYKAKVALTHGPENAKPQVKHIDENGRFCFMVPPGEYRLSAIAATVEDAPNLQFLPAYIDIIVKSPVLHIEFSQAQVNILGAVICKEQCSKSVFVSLTSLLSKEMRTVVLGDGSSEFVFPNVLPGKYRLQVKHNSSHPSSNGEDNWCWEHDTIEVDVGTEDKKGVVFVQKGFWIDIISTHDVDAHILSPEEPPISLLIKKGPQRICIQSHGLHELHLGDSCISFGNSTLKFDTSIPTQIVISGQKYLVKGAIQFDAKSVHDSKKLAERIMIDVYDRNNQVLDTIRVNLMPDENGSKDSLLYEYSVWANYGDELVFVPRDSGGIQERKFLFYPRTQQVGVVTDGCQAPVAPFDGRLGIYIEGSVSPAISGVDIKVVSLGESQNAQLQKGDLVLETKTGSDGSFSGGPLYGDTSYTVEAFKPGYHLKPVGHYSFACQKLSRINVKIYSGEELAVHFPPVLLSLSGEDGYRNNSVTNAGGIFSFEDLFPGSFYLRPLLKEYSFSPAAQAIDLGSGEFKEVIFHATRVAYSATGTVSLLSGQPKEGILVEARSPSKGYYEESTTDSFGHFRLRGLIPNTTYFLKVVSKEDSGTRIERASPDSVTIEVGSEDIKGVDFVVFEEPETTILSGHVEGIDLIDLQPHITVQIRSEDNPSKAVAALPLPLSHYFQVRGLPKSKHFVQLIFGHSSSTRKFESEILEVDLTMQPQIHVGPLKYKVLELHHKLEPTPAPVFPLIIGVCIIALFISMPRLRDILNWAVNSASTASVTFVAKKETKKPVTRKRAY
ncbi:uncharacterized protein LOC116262346 [Nymphaea colorata]|nr:uncharacterized protein LOC116262346 [Nymphaea colorata]